MAAFAADGSNSVTRESLFHGGAHRYVTASGLFMTNLDSFSDPSNGSGMKNNAEPEVIRVLLVDTQTIYRVGMRNIFAVEDNIRVVAEVESSENLQAAIDRFPASLAIVEDKLVASPEALTTLIRLAPQMKIVVVGEVAERNAIVEFYRAGVRGMILRSISPDLLVKCVRQVAAGETWMDQRTINWVLEAYRSNTGATTANSSAARPHLSPKELAVIARVSEGKRNKEIAYELGTSEQVIKNYLRKVYEKLGVSDRVELALYSLDQQAQKRVNG